MVMPYKPESWWLQTLGGLLCIAGGVGMYYILIGQELAPNPNFKAPWLAVLLHWIGGKWAVVGLFFLLGGLVAGFGLWRKVLEIYVRRKQRRLALQQQQQRRQQLTKLVQQGKTVEAMKLYREWTSASLVEAKQVIDGIREQSTTSEPTN